MLQTMIKLCIKLIFILVIHTSALRAQVYKPTWESLDKRPIPNWWTDAKFGIFIHWGIYSVPAYAPINEVDGVYEKYAEHYENRLIQKNKIFTQHHEKYYGDNFSYQDFAPMFKAEFFNPDSWSELIKLSGAKYALLTSKHHDGYCLWPSKESPNWNSMDIGPHRDLVGELSESIKKKGLRMGLYYSLLEWNQPLYSPSTINKWTNDHLMPQLKDLVTRYSPEIIFADGEWDYSSEEFKSENFLSWLYNESPVKKTVVVNDRWGKETRSKHGDYYTTEYDMVHNTVGIGDEASHPWEESRGMGTSYGYNQFETINDYSTSKQLVDLLIDKVSNGGNLLLDIGPKANGLIPVIMQERLLDMGKWLAVNGEAIYGTSIWETRPKVNQDILAFTKKGNNIYIICKKWPDRLLKIPGISKFKKLSMLGKNVMVSSKIIQNTLVIQPPILNINELPCDYAWVFKVEIEL